MDLTKEQILEMIYRARRVAVCLRGCESAYICLGTTKEHAVGMIEELVKGRFVVRLGISDLLKDTLYIEQPRDL